MTDGQPQRKIAVTQLDEIWQVAASKWGDPGRRTPTPDPRFEQLRRHLNNIEVLFGQNIEEEPERPHFNSQALKVAQKKNTYLNGGRKIEHQQPAQPFPVVEVNMFGDPAPVMVDEDGEEVRGF